jgi:hypothetical protein
MDATPTGRMLLLQATVQVPLDAYKMDFVFADVEAGEGAYDNHGGFDYHLPVEGSGLTEPALHVVCISERGTSDRGSAETWSQRPPRNQAKT